MINRTIKYILTIVIVGLNISSCSDIHTKKGENTLEGVWIGQYIHEAYLFPNPILLDLTKGGKVFFYDFKKNQNDTLVWHTLNNDTISIGKNEIKFELKPDQLVFQFEKEKHFFQRLHESDSNFPTSKLQKTLTSKSWLINSSSVEGEHLKKTSVYTFNLNNTAVIHNTYSYDGQKIYSEKEQLCYSIHHYKNNSFLVLKGNLSSCSSDFIQLLQLDNLDEDEIVLLSRQGLTGSKIILSAYESTAYLNDMPSYEVCNASQITQYFNIETKYKGGLKAITKEFDQKYNILKSDRDLDTGILRVRFVVNCYGNTGRPSVQGLDFNYNLKLFSYQTVSQILKITMSLSDWKPGSVNNKEYDSYRHLTFKLEKGEIVEVFP